MNLPHDYILIRADEIAKDTVRTAYNLACEIDGFNDKESVAKMFQRVQMFIANLQNELMAIELSGLSNSHTIEGATKAQFAGAAFDETRKVMQHFKEVYLPYTKKQWAKLDN